jgi:glycosyltransferase involved in cell wall biosynthesis
MPRKPRILVLSSSWPRGGAFGGQLRALHLGRALKAIGDVTFAVATSDETDAESMRQTGEEFGMLDPVRLQTTPNHHLGAKLRWALDGRYLNVHGCSATAAESQRIFAAASSHDLVWLLNSRTPNVLGHWFWPRSHLDIDDVPSTYAYHQAAARLGIGVLGKLRARLQQRLLRRRENYFKVRFSTLSVCSAADRAYLDGGENMHVIPNGFQQPKALPRRALKPQSPRIGFIGLYSYAPNRDGVQWFLRECWPAIRSAVPGIRLRLIGKDTDGPLRPTEPDVDALGWVADSGAEIATWSSMIVPIRFGGGTRIKIAEAFSRKCPAVSTHLGAFGYDLTDQKQLRLADDPAAFARACIATVREPRTAAAMAEQAWSEFLEKWTWDAIAPKVWRAAEDCLRRSRS